MAALRGDSGLPLEAQKLLSFTDNRQTILNAPVDPRLPWPYNHEPVYAAFHVDEDLILDVRAHGATRQLVARNQVQDLKFGLRV